MCSLYFQSPNDSRLLRMESCLHVCWFASKLATGDPHGSHLPWSSPKHLVPPWEDVNYRACPMRIQEHLLSQKSVSLSADE